jgi:hypothetical protein
MVCLSVLSRQPNNRFWKGYSEVLGIFPFVGTPFRRAAEGTSEATNNILVISLMVLHLYRQCLL